MWVFIKARHDVAALVLMHAFIVDKSLLSQTVLSHAMPSSHSRSSSTSWPRRFPCFACCSLAAKQAAEPAGHRPCPSQKIQRSNSKPEKRPEPVPDMDALAGEHESLELVQLPGGRVVAADSQGGTSRRTSQVDGEATDGGAHQPGLGEQEEAVPRTDEETDDAFFW